MVFQSYAICPHMNVFENIAFPLRMLKTPKDEVKSKVKEVLDMVELKGLGERMPDTLSGGQQQSVALSRGLVAPPRVLLLDEPLSNLDAKLREKMRKDEKNIQKHFQITCVYVTHDQVEAFNTSERTVIMNKGNILQLGTPEGIGSAPANKFVKDFIS